MLACLSKGKLGLPVGASLAEHRTKSPEGHESYQQIHKKTNICQ